MIRLRRPDDQAMERFRRAYADAPPAYEPVGSTRAERPPEGFHANRGAAAIGHGADDFARAVAALRAWAMYDLPWTHLHPPAAPVREGEVTVVRARHFGLWSLNATRIVYVDESETELAFALGTLPGHVERGEERFAVSLEADGTVRFSLRAYARPHHLLSRLAAPLTRRTLAAFAREAPRAVRHAVARRSAG